MNSVSNERAPLKVVGLKVPGSPILPLPPEKSPTLYKRMCISLQKVKVAIQRA